MSSLLRPGAAPATYVQTMAGTTREIRSQGDQDGDADLPWHHAGRGEVRVWLMNGATRLSATWAGTVPDTGYRIVGVK